MFTGRRTLRAEHPDRFDAWAAGHTDELVELEVSRLEAMAGDTLLHTDLRDDNMMITCEAGADRVLVSDWAWPARGAAWVDVAFFVPQLVRAGHSPTQAEQLLDSVATWDGATPGAVTDFAAGLADLWSLQAVRDTHEGLRRYHLDAARAGRA